MVSEAKETPRDEMTDLSSVEHGANFEALDNYISLEK